MEKQQRSKVRASGIPGSYLSFPTRGQRKRKKKEVYRHERRQSFQKQFIIRNGKRGAGSSEGTRGRDSSWEDASESTKEPKRD